MLVFLGDLGVRPEKSAKVISQSAALGLTTILIDDETVSIPLPAACRIRVTLYPHANAQRVMFSDIGQILSPHA